MKGMRTGLRALGLAALTGLLVAGTLTAQGRDGRRGQADRGGRGPMLGTQIEAALEHADTLGLTEEQQTLLRALKEEVAVAEEQLETRRAEMRQNARSEGARNGEGREGARGQAQAVREEMQEIMRPLAERWQEIVSDEQRQQLRALVGPRRPGSGEARRGGGQGRRDAARAGRQARRDAPRSARPRGSCRA